MTFLFFLTVLIYHVRAQSDLEIYPNAYTAYKNSRFHND